MIPIAAGVRIWIASGHTDMRNYAPTMIMRSRRSFNQDLPTFLVG
ncbi:MAG: hypothetical protein JWP84_5257 [Tardiphaga sp.]|nr:hypothetical protein [Tardiphaga sp.]